MTPDHRSPEQQRVTLLPVPYRIDIASPPEDVVDRLIQLGALDFEASDNALAAIIPDAIAVHDITRALGVVEVGVSPVVARDAGSVWLLRPRSVRIGNILIAPAEAVPHPGALRLTDSPAFGTGHHPTTALCIEALQEVLALSVPDSVLDVGTGSGVLALAALMIGAPKAVGLDIDTAALAIAARHARLNKMSKRFRLVLGGPDALEGAWPLVVANLLAAALIEMAPMLVKRVAPHGRLIVSGVPCALECEVLQAYQRFGMRHLSSQERAGWTALLLQTSW